MAIVKCRECGNEISTTAKSCPKCGAKMPKRTSVITWVIAGVMMLLLFNFFSYINEGAKNPTPKLVDQRIKVMEKVDVNIRWSKGGFDNVMIAEVTIKNGSDKAIKDISVLCVLKGNSGTSLGKLEHTIYEVVKAKKTRVFKDINMGLINSQAAIANCKIEALEIAIQ